MYLLSPETCRILELGWEGSGCGSGSPWSSSGAVSECWQLPRFHLPECGGFAGVGKEWQDRTLAPLCSCPVLLQFLWGCSLQVPPGWCHTRFLLRGSHTTKTSCLSCLKQSFLGIFTLWSLLLKLSLAAAALRIPVGAEVEAEHFWAGLGQRRLQHQELSLPEHTGTFCHL